MIIDVEGDILLSKAKAIAHSVAPNDDFHSGLALSLRERWPGMYKDFRHYCRQDHPSPGGVWAWKGPGSPVLFSLFNQEGAYGQGAKPGKAAVEYVNRSLSALQKAVESENLDSIAMSRLATGVGGLDWKDVEPLIKKYFENSPVKVYIYQTFRKDVPAKEV